MPLVGGRHRAARRDGWIDVTAAGERVVYVLRSFPRLSQTFILNELLALEAGGIDVAVVSLVRAADRLTHERLGSLHAPVLYLDEPTHRARRRVVAHLVLLLRRPGRYLRTAVRLARQPEATSGYHGVTRPQAFDRAVVAVHLLGLRGRHGVVRLHAHFAHDPALVAQLASGLSGVPYSFTGHARDLVQISERALASRVAGARAVVTCCEMNADLIGDVSSKRDRQKVHVIPNGIDTSAFAPCPAGSDGAQPGTVVSVGRFVEKKGFEILIDAVARVVRSGQATHLTIYGDGPLRADLEARIAANGVGAYVTLAGECTQAELQRVLPRCSIFALTPYVGGDGDRDGLPTVLVEAMACGVPVVTTDVAGIPDLVDDGRNGFMCPPREAAPVADALRQLLGDEALRRRMAVAARATVVERFDQAVTSRQVADLLLGRAPDRPRSAERQPSR